MLIRVGRGSNYSEPLIQCLEIVKDEYGFDMEPSNDIPPYSIWIEEKPIAHIDISDGFAIQARNRASYDEFDYKIILKFHYHSALALEGYYGPYTDKIVPCGLYRFWQYTEFNKQDLLTRERPVDVVALMRWSNSSTPPDSMVPWAIARRTLVSLADGLQKKGYNTRAGSKIGLLPYENLLLDTKIGFIWSASAYLGWKIPEFTQQGVIMITEPLGENFPLVNDAIFEDNVNCVFCSDPNLFGQVAIELLNDKERLNYLRRNVVELWEKKLAPRQVGKWLYKKIIEAC